MEYSRQGPKGQSRLPELLIKCLWISLYHIHLPYVAVFGSFSRVESRAGAPALDSTPLSVLIIVPSFEFDLEINCCNCSGNFQLDSLANSLKNQVLWIK